MTDLVVNYSAEHFHKPQNHLVAYPHPEQNPMAGEQAGVRRILPQSTQMQNFSFVPNNFTNREPQKSMLGSENAVVLVANQTPQTMYLLTNTIGISG